jgi:hypothetical protein
MSAQRADEEFGVIERSDESVDVFCLSLEVIVVGDFAVMSPKHSNERKLNEIKISVAILM